MGEEGGGVFLRVPSHPRYLSVVRQVVGATARLAGFSESDKAMIVLAVDEAVSNCIRHGYGEDYEQAIEISIADGEESLEVRVRDFGPKPDVAKIIPRDLHDLRPGGLGTHFMRRIMDEVEFDTSNEAWNEVRLVRYKGEPKKTLA